MNEYNRTLTVFYLLIICIILIIGDFLSTYYALQYFNAIEINPLYTMCGSILFFFVVKGTVTATYIIIILSCYKEYYKSTITSLIILMVIYGVIVTSNVIQLISYYALY